jgi:Undecaprenyl-phosphate glucose phosphotransferase
MMLYQQSPAVSVFNVKRRARSGPVSLVVVAGVLRVLDVSIILGSGIAIYEAYVAQAAAAHWTYYYLAAVAGLFVSGVVFHINGLYKPQTMGTGSFKIARLFSSWSLVMLSLVVLAYLLHLSEFYSRAWLLLWFVAAFSGMGACRVGLWSLERRWMREGRLTRTVAIVGGGRHGAKLMQTLTASNPPGIEVLGYFDDRRDRIDPAMAQQGCERLGTVEELMRFSRIERIDQIIVALPWSAEYRMLDILNKLKSLPINIQLAPDMVGFHVTHSAYSTMGGVPLLHVFQRPLADWHLVIKEIEDRFLAAVLLLFLAPLLLFLAILVKLDSSGPVFFRQQRYGFNNRLFGVLKFRTMFHHLRDDAAQTLATRNDPRVTRLGAFLRKSSLDELPQLFNVLLGDMSIVGPRPHATSAKAADRLYEEVVAEYAARHRVKPGITGWAQVNGWRGETDTYEKIRKRVEYDLYYIENWSLALDIKILVLTAIALFKTENAY